VSTISTRTASQLASDHARHGQSYVAAPVFENPDAAKARQLFVIAGGAFVGARFGEPVWIFAAASPGMLAFALACIVVLP
jgi:3-hydroxyisobutyrate dehydrogenase-like beta-hydroxyacid dehydrogenase